MAKGGKSAHVEPAEPAERERMAAAALARRAKEQAEEAEELAPDVDAAAGAPAARTDDGAGGAPPELEDEPLSDEEAIEDATPAANALWLALQAARAALGFGKVRDAHRLCQRAASTAARTARRFGPRIGRRFPVLLGLLGLAGDALVDALEDHLYTRAERDAKAAKAPEAAPA